MHNSIDLAANLVALEIDDSLCKDSPDPWACYESLETMAHAEMCLYERDRRLLMERDWGIPYTEPRFAGLTIERGT